MQILFALVVAVCLALSPYSTAAAQTVTPLPFHELGTELDYDVVPWAHPLASGPLRVLAIAPYATLGDFASLRDYIEVELETVAVWDRDHLGFDPQFPEPAFPDASHEAVEKRLLRLLEKTRYHAIIIGQCDPRAFPDAVQQRIIEHAEAGTGLLITGSQIGPGSVLGDWLQGLSKAETPPVLTRGVGPMGIPDVDRDALVSCGTVGEGRVVTFTFLQAPSLRHCLIPVPQNPFDMVEEYEANAFSLACKALAWVAGREPAVTVSHLVDATPKGPEDEEIPPGYPPEFIESIRKNAFSQPIRPFILQLDSPAPETCEVAYRVRLPGISLPAIISTTKSVLLSKGASYYPLDLLVGSPGDYLVDVWIRNRKGVLAWHTEVVSVPGWPRLRDITISQDGKKAVWLNPNDHLDVSAAIDAVSAMTPSDGATVIARAIDSYGRQVAGTRQVLGATGGTASLRLDLADLFAPLIRVELFALPSALAEDAVLLNQAARSVFYFPVRLPDRVGIPSTVVTASGPFDYGAIRQLQRLRRALGAGALHAPLNADSLLAASKAGLSRIAQLGTLDEGRVGPGSVRVPCLSSPEYRQQETGAIASGVLEAWAGGAPMYSLGAGCALTDTDAGVCQSPACLARFQAYLRGQYENLNALNQAWGKSFARWEEIVPDPLDSCQQQRVWAPWLDFRLAMDQVFAEAHQHGRNAVHSVDGAGRTGFQALYDGITPMTGYDWRRLCGVTDFLTVPPESRAIRRLQSYHGARSGSGIVLGEKNLRANPMLARWSVWNSLFHQLPAVWLDEPFDAGARGLLSPLGEPEPGIAALGDALATVQAGVGALLLNAEPHPSGIAFADSPATAYLDYADPNVTRSSAASEAWLAETINRLGFSASVHPLSAMAERDLKHINTLILSRLRSISNTELDMLKNFHDNNGLIIADGYPGELDGHGVPRQGAALPYLHPLNPGHSDSKATLWTNRPVWVNQLGVEAATDEELLARLLARAGNEPFLPIQLPKKQQGAVARFQFRYGAAILSAFLPDPAIDSAVRSASMKLPEKHFAADLLHPAETTPRGRVQWSALAGEPALFAILPYRVDRILAEVPELVVAGQRIVVRMLLDTGGTPPGAHLILLQLEAPGGEELSHYRQHVDMRGGIAETFVPLAENEVPGVYLLHVTDVLSQTHAAYPVEIAS